MTTRRALIATLALLPLAACGRKGKPIPPEGSLYPRKYPTVDFPDGQTTPPKAEPTTPPKAEPETESR